jgi:transcriptional regulator with XRE-family HTH domain
VKTISRYESGKSSPKALVLRKMANTYKCSVYELLDIPRQ